MPVGSAPIDEVGALVESAGRRSGVLGAEVAGFVPALALLDLPPSYVRVDEHVGVPGDEGRPRAQDEDKPPGHPSHLLAESLDERRCEELIQAPRAQETEDAIVAD